MNIQAVRAIYYFEMARWGRTLLQSVVAPVVSTALYFVVFGSAIGTRIADVDGVAYGSFIVPGLVMLLLLTQSATNASFGIYFPRFTGTVYELLSAPVSPLEIVLVLEAAEQSSAPARNLGRVERQVLILGECQTDRVERPEPGRAAVFLAAAADAA